MTIPMPEPVMRIYAEGSMRTVTEWRDGACDLPDGDHDLITTDQAEAYAAAKVREALDRAIAICDAAYEQGKGAYRASCDPYFEGGCDAAELIESRIRALIPPLSGPVEPTT